MQKFKIFIIMFFFAIIIVPILLFNREENFISKIDNRELMNNPLGPNYSSTASGDFTDDMETYFQDRIGLRNEMMYVYTVLNDICFDEMANNYTEGKEGYVFSKIGSNVVFNEYHIEFANMVKKIQSYCEEREIPFVFVFNPSKATVLQEKLPEGVNYDAGWVEKFLSELEERNINYVDNTATLEEKEEEGKKVFNKKYDAGHWNDWGAFYGVNSILENLQQFYPLLPLNKEEDFIIGRELNTTLLQSLYPINEYSPVFTIKNSEKIKDITELYEGEVELDPNHRNFQYTVNEEVKKSGSPKTLVFQGSYMNGKGAKFLQNSLGEYIAVHDYQNVINFDYYFNLFEPDCVIFEVAEYTLTDAYFNSENMKAMELNPLLENFNNITEVSKDIRLLDVDIEEGNEITKIKVSNTSDAEYAYIDIDGRIYDLRYSDDGNCYEVSILKERMGNIDNIILIKDDIKEIYSGIPAA